MDGSCASSQSGDSFLALMLGAEGSPAQQPAHSSPAAVAALPNGPTCFLLAGAGKAAHAEQPPRGSENSCFEPSPALPDPQLDEMILQADSSDGSAEWLPSAQAQPYGADPSNVQQAAQPVPMPSKKRGRPRRYDTTLPLGECGWASCLCPIKVTGSIKRSSLIRWDGQVIVPEALAIWLSKDPFKNTCLA